MIFDLLAKEVAVSGNNENKEVGCHSVTWEG
jgi:hypothetical protein